MANLGHLSGTNVTVTVVIVGSGCIVNTIGIIVVAVVASFAFDCGHNISWYSSHYTAQSNDTPKEEKEEQDRITDKIHGEGDDVIISISVSRLFSAIVDVVIVVIIITSSRCTATVGRQ
jgi:hypothetical protein